MNGLIDAVVSRARPVLLVLALLLVAGVVAYVTIPKESDPDIAIPTIYVNVLHEGISPEDAERLLVRPMEKELRTIEGLKELRATAAEGSGVIILEFEAGFDADQALADVRERVDIAKAELPADTDEPLVREINIALFPVLVVNLHGEVPERTLVNLARNLRDNLEGLPGVLQVDIAGDREELLEVIVDPVRLESYNLSYQDLFNYVARNNRLVAAGALDTGHGRFAVKVPGVFEDLEHLLSLPIKTEGGRAVTFADIATVRRTFKDPTSYARLNGERAVALEVSKRIGSNIIDVVDAVRASVAAEQANWPANVQVTFTQDNSNDVRTMLKDLQNNVLTAVLLVMIVIVAALGPRSAALVGISIPGSFLTAMLVLALTGFSINIVVLFSLIMAVGMLVDGAIVVVELADRQLSEGATRTAAYMFAAKRMAWPITASTATTLAAFLPLLFWPGIVGEFMKFLPLTLVMTLAASLLMALLFVPTVGTLLGRRTAQTHARGTQGQMAGLTDAYVRLLGRALDHPGKIVLGAVAVLIAVYALYGVYGRGVEFFPTVDNGQAVLNVHARGDLSIDERDALVRAVEQRILDMPELESVYARSGVRFGNESDEDVIGRIQLRLVDWDRRRPGAEVMQEVRARTADLAGIAVEVQRQNAGPTTGKPIRMQLTSRRPDLLAPAVGTLRAGMDQIEGLVDVTDSRPLAGIDWRIEVDRAQAARFGADVTLVGNSIQLVTNGIKIGEYRPDDADDEIDIRVRFPDTDRSLQQLDRLRITSSAGTVPVSNFMNRVAAPRVGNLERTNGARTLTIGAGVTAGTLVDDKVKEIQAWLANASIDPQVRVTFRGEDEEQRSAQAFLTRAFGAALFLMAIILVTQFNSFYQSALILSAVIFSTVGVLLGLLITGQPFGVVMSGIGVIALAGIVVNNNIVLIDTFNLVRREGLGVRAAVLETCSQRLRPVLLTTVTTILGLMPMVLGMNIDLIGRTVQIGGPSTQWWTQLATAVAGGLAFATVLTLVMTPCLLLLGSELGVRLRAGTRRLLASLTARLRGRRSVG